MEMEDGVRQVLCRKYGEQLPGLPAPPIPGAMGRDIFENVSAKAWTEWRAVQTMLINERHLNLIEPDARKFLAEQMRRFLANEPYEMPSGYTPPDERGTEER